MWKAFGLGGFHDGVVVVCFVFARKLQFLGVGLGGCVCFGLVFCVALFFGFLGTGLLMGLIVGFRLEGVLGCSVFDLLFMYVHFSMV